MAVKKGNSFIDIGEDFEDFILLKVFLFLHQLEELSIKTRLHYQIYIITVVEEAVKLHNVGVVEVHLNFYLLHERLLNIFLPN